ncbi:MAG: autophagy protein 13 [Trizodia sp. TS-e1964]|nr:MAG: autophagy protein 13 [Trizodia sp. TS-e1964]
MQPAVSQQPGLQAREGKARINQIVQFNIEIDETEYFRDATRLWKNCDALDSPPPPMIIETYLDTADLTSSQSLVIVDDHGKRWNVADALNSYHTLDARTTGQPERKTQVLLERWIVELGDAPITPPQDLASVLPIVYKKSIVLFRSLFTYSKFLPAWKYVKRPVRDRQSHGSSLKVNCRIITGDQLRSSRYDGLSIPLFDGNGRVTEDFSFGSVESPAGAFSVKVSYRTSCEFRVDDSEALLSSHFMGMDEHLFTPSLETGGNHLAGYQAHAKEVGSLPQERRGYLEKPDRSQAYGSLSTFHQVGPPTSSSPLSALRAARELGSDSPQNSPPQRALPTLRSAQGSRSSVRSPDAMPSYPRRPSVSFMPFKASSLSESPSPGVSEMPPPPSPRSASARTAGISGLSALAQARNRNSLQGNLPLSTLRGIPIPADNGVAISSNSSSPRGAPVPKYSSSFGHRRARLSGGGSGGNSKTEDDSGSAKGSIASSLAQPGSGILMEGAAGASSGSIATDDDNISDFLKLLDTKKELKSFALHSDSDAIDASTSRTNTALLKFQRMKDSNAALSESLSTSLFLQRSSSSSSRQLTSVPPMVTGTSISTASSPGKPISPHTPHTPAIPSRLNTNSVATYSQPHRSRSSGRSRASRDGRGPGRDRSRGGDGGQGPGTTAIDIPTSPRLYNPHNRRSSSVAQRHRTSVADDEAGDLMPYGIRSASVGTEDRPPLNLSALLALADASEAALPLNHNDNERNGDEEGGSAWLGACFEMESGI